MENNFPRGPPIEGLTVANLMTSNANVNNIKGMKMCGEVSTKNLAPGTIGNWMRTEGITNNITNLTFGGPSPETQESTVSDILAQKAATLEDIIPNGNISCEVVPTKSEVLSPMPQSVDAEIVSNQMQNSTSSIESLIDQDEANDVTDHSPVNQNATGNSSNNNKIIPTKGGAWNNIVYYTDDPQSKLIEPTKKYDSELAFFKSVEGSNETIKNVSVLKNNLLSWFPKSFNVWHEFVIIQTENYYWSFEKNTKGIWIQKWKDINSLKLYCHGVKRKETVKFRKIRFHLVNSGDSIYDIFEWIHRKDYLNDGYHLFKRNCQVFAKGLCESVLGNKGKRIKRSLFYTEDADVLYNPDSMAETKSYDEISVWCENVAANEQIKRIWIITQRGGTDKHISSDEAFWPMPKGVKQREFAIVESTNGTRELYWSFDKIPDGICVQRGRNSDNLEKKYRGMKRPKISDRIGETSINNGKTIRDILSWILREYLSTGPKLNTWKNNPDNFGSQLYNSVKHTSKSAQVPNAAGICTVNITGAILGLR